MMRQRFSALLFLVALSLAVLVSVEGKKEHRVSSSVSALRQQTADAATASDASSTSRGKQQQITVVNNVNTLSSGKKQQQSAAQQQRMQQQQEDTEVKQKAGEEQQQKRAILQQPGAALVPSEEGADTLEGPGAAAPGAGVGGVANAAQPAASTQDATAAGAQAAQPGGVPVSQPVGQPVSQPVGQPVSQPVGQPVSQPAGQPAQPTTGQPAAPTSPSATPTDPSSPEQRKLLVVNNVNTLNDRRKKPKPDEEPRDSIRKMEEESQKQHKEAKFKILTEEANKRQDEANAKVKQERRTKRSERRVKVEEQERDENDTMELKEKVATGQRAREMRDKNIARLDQEARSKKLKPFQQQKQQTKRTTSRVESEEWDSEEEIQKVNAAKVAYSTSTGTPATPDAQGNFDTEASQVSVMNLCTLATACGQSWKDYGVSGIVLRDKDLAKTPFTKGSKFNSKWDWIHPRICCAEAEAANKDFKSVFVLGASCLNGMSNWGVGGIIMRQKDCPASPFRAGQPFNDWWSWTHPNLCQVPSRTALRPAQANCMLGTTTARCPIGWNNHGYVGILVPTSSTTHPFAKGAVTSFSTDWSWAHPCLCCLN